VTFANAGVAGCPDGGWDSTPQFQRFQQTLEFLKASGAEVRYTTGVSELPDALIRRLDLKKMQPSVALIPYIG